MPACGAAGRPGSRSAWLVTLGGGPWWVSLQPGSAQPPMRYPPASQPVRHGIPFRHPITPPRQRLSGRRRPSWHSCAAWPPSSRARRSRWRPSAPRPAAHGGMQRPPLPMPRRAPGAGAALMPGGDSLSLRARGHPVSLHRVPALQSREAVLASQVEEWRMRAQAGSMAQSELAAERKVV